MMALLLSPLGRWLAGGALIFALVGGGYLYVSHLRHKVQALEIQNQQLERAKGIYEQDKKTDEETETEQDRIDNLAPGELGVEFDRLRKRSQSQGGKSSKAGD